MGVLTAESSTVIPPDLNTDEVGAKVPGDEETKDLKADVSFGCPKGVAIAGVDPKFIDPEAKTLNPVLD